MKKLCLTLVIFIFMSFIVSCTKNETSQKLVVLNGISNPITPNIISTFEQENNIDIEVIEWDQNGEMDIETFYKNISTEIMAGKGPDVVLFDETLWYYLDGNKAVKSGAFMNMNVLIEKDNNFDKNNINKIVWDAGKIDGAQYIAPITYYTPLCISSGKLLNDANFNINNCDNILQFINEAEKYEATDKIISMPLYDSNILSIVDFFFSSGCYNINYDTSSMSIDNHSAKIILDYLHKYESKLTAPIEYPFYENQSVLKTSWKNNSFSSVIQTIRWLDSTDNKPIIIPLKDVRGDMTSMFSLALSINANSKNKENAYSFLKYLVFDYMYGNSNYNGNIPIASSSIEHYYNNYLSGKNSALSTSLQVDGVIYTLPPLSKQLYDEYTNQISNISQCRGFYGKFDSVLMNELQPYFDNKKSYEECIQSAQSKLEIYISE